MTRPLLPGSSVEDAAVDLIRAAERLRESRIATHSIAAALDRRWAANRSMRARAGPQTRSPDVLPVEDNKRIVTQA